MITIPKGTPVKICNFMGIENHIEPKRKHKKKRIAKKWLKRFGYRSVIKQSPSCAIINGVACMNKLYYDALIKRYGDNTTK